MNATLNEVPCVHGQCALYIYEGLIMLLTALAQHTGCVQGTILDFQVSCVVCENVKVKCESLKVKVWKWKCETESVKVKVWKWKCESESMHPPSFLQPGSDPLVSGCPGFGSWRSSEHSFKSQCPSFTISSYVPYHFFGLYSSAAYLVSSFPSDVLQAFPPYSPLRFGNLASLYVSCNLSQTWQWLNLLHVQIC